MRTDLLAVFAREPVPGRVKTRLAKDVGTELAAALYDIMLRNTLEKVISPQYNIVIYKTPESGRTFFEKLFPGAVFRNQPKGDLGEKMSGVFKEEFGRGYRRICLIGTDCTSITSYAIMRAFELLEKSELVLGPSSDGGYYLIGLSVFYPELFEGIAWSTDKVLSRTLGIADSLGIGFDSLEVMTDIDDINDLERYMSEHSGTELAVAFEKVFKERGWEKDIKS